MDLVRCLHFFDDPSRVMCGDLLTLVETHHYGVGKTKTKSLQIIILLDILPPHHIDREELAASVERSHRWEVRSLFEHLLDSRDRRQAIFCVIHGGTDVELRTKSLEYLTTLPWDGYAIGGSLGEFSVFTRRQ